jgi:hypothetical protein
VARRCKELENEAGHFLDAIGKELLSPSLAKRLQDVEAEQAALHAPPNVVNAETLLRRLPEAAQRFRHIARNPDGSALDVTRMRAHRSQVAQYAAGRRSPVAGRREYCFVGRKPRCSYCRSPGSWQVRPPALRPRIGGRAYI